MTISNILRRIEHDPDFFPISCEKETGALLQALISLTEPVRILEIGTYKGYSTLHMLQAITRSRHSSITTVDIDMQFYPNYKLLSAQDKKQIRLLNTDSINLVKIFKDRGTFDFIFIDGDHNFYGCLIDALSSLLTINKTGVIVFHDAMSKDQAGVRSVISLLRSINVLSFNSLFDILTIPTPARADASGVLKSMGLQDSVSGLCIVRVKNQTILIKYIAYISLKLLGFWKRLNG